MSKFGDVVLTRGAVQCPAGEPLAGCTACRCRIEDSIIDLKSSPSTLVRHCLDDPGYQDCSTWRADKEYVWSARSNRGLLTRDGDLRVEDAQEPASPWAS